MGEEERERLIEKEKRENVDELRIIKRNVQKLRDDFLRDNVREFSLTQGVISSLPR
jgi:hypothetical protein